MHVRTRISRYIDRGQTHTAICMSELAMVIARNSRNFQRSPFGKTGESSGCLPARYDAFGLETVEMAKMVKRRKWKPARRGRAKKRVRESCP